CYRVEAIESVNSYGIAETAFSNVECAELEPIVWVPSGFMKNGINNIFKPVISLFEFSSYKMVIFDRWGHIVFETEDYNVGWDGTLKNGKISPESTFVYMIEFQDAAGVTHISRGAVTFLIAEE
ncbi:MAG: gliding motility-associated C-terminal domain-containing protein, partial [Crocinitomicaceae bacterium]